MAGIGGRRMLEVAGVWVVLSVLAAVCNGVEQMVVLQAPESVKFRSGENVRLSQMPDILSALWGFTTQKHQKWSGLESGKPFKRPEAIVCLEIEGFHTLQSDSSGKVFPLETDVEPGWPYQLAADRTYVRFPNNEPFLMEIVNDDSIFSVKSQYSKLLKTLPAKPNELEDSVFGENSIIQGGSMEALNLTLVPDMKAMMDIQLPLETARIVAQKSSLVHDGIPDLYWFRIPGLQELISVYGSGSAQVQEAMKLAMKSVDETKKLFSKAYGGNVVVILLGVDYFSGNSIQNLQRRSLLQDVKTTDAPPPKPKKMHVATFYDEGYSAAFNIIFLTTLIFALTTFGIALGMWHIDPGRDSIIYRMTSQRMKKDQ